MVALSVIFFFYIMRYLFVRVFISASNRVYIAESLINFAFGYFPPLAVNGTWFPCRLYGADVACGSTSRTHVSKSCMATPAIHLFGDVMSGNTSLSTSGDRVWQHQPLAF